MINKEDFYLFGSLTGLRYDLLSPRKGLIEALNRLKERRKKHSTYHPVNHDKLIEELQAAVDKVESLISITEEIKNDE